ncbi:sulfatase-like hydrolase/transferase [Novipirellula artificiosorum]|uniref:Arylsulfatase n=1 Tax=Novipirellula artificiosorum TaxID=2528016 RepID=A0A5C6DLR5_9BACT|nr:sulfatase-like hydrolase/transferase [Novipirellula artificiosorum]TWU38333.1 Arylsulfatase [Novipirellula artificiosorum]
MKHFSSTLLVITTLLTSVAVASEKPNILLVYADDISARELPIYGSSVWSHPTRGDTTDEKVRAKTPVLDQMASEGCWVKTAWASVVCSPSRAMMMTGRYAHLHKWWNNKDKGQYIDENGKLTVWPLYRSSPRLIGHVAQQAGYGTYWAGKTQMAGDLKAFGFDQGCFTPGNLSDNDNPFTDFKMRYKTETGKKLLLNADTGQPIDSYLQHGWYFYPHVRLMNHDDRDFQWWPNTAESEKSFGIGTYGPDVELDFIFDFMERQHEQDKPFFVYHTTHLGHDAFDWLNPESESRWPGTPVIHWDGTGYTRTQPNITGDHGVYDSHGTVTEPGIHTHINYLDYQMGLYRNKIKEMGIEENTIVIFCADNGTSGYGKNSSDRQKGTHVPLIIYAPGMTKHGEQDVLVNLSDMLPTIAEFAGVELPVDYPINGESLVPFLMTDKPKHRDWIYAYSRAHQIIRGERVMKDGFNKWWDVSTQPDDLIRFNQITDWDTVSAEHRTERDLLNEVLPRFDLHATEHDAPGVKLTSAATKKRAKQANLTKKPNVILIVTDDQGYGDMSCHGNPWLKTPNLDRLSQQSVRLEDYHVDPVCTPTRAALMTGRYSTRVGAWDVVQGRQLLGADETTMADLFSKSGYRTAMFGKWHLGDAWPYAPRFRGFQNVVRHLAGGIDEIGNPIGNDYFDDTYYRNGTPEKIAGYCTDVFFRECRRFVSEPSDKPFFVYLPLNAMHSPHTVPQKYSAPFRAQGHAEMRSKFFGQIVHFDENLGRLLDVMETNKLTEDTIVIFMGDNGSAAGTSGSSPDDGFNAGMRGKKGSVFEGGHRVACFVRWPVRLKAGHVVDELTSCRDWLPTLVDWCGLQLPKSTRFDGRSLQPLIDENAHNWPDRTLFVQRQGDQPILRESDKHHGAKSHYAVLTENWRLVDGQLYDIVRDPGQTSDVANQYAEIVRDLQRQYEDHFAEVFADGEPYARFQLGAADENPTLLTVRDWHPTVGNVIWKQDQLGDDSLAINGFWAVNVVQAGHYSIRLSRFPDDAPQSMSATKAILQIGDQTLEKKLGGTEASVMFEVDLPKGHGLLQTWLSGADGKTRGAYFVQVHHATKKPVIKKYSNASVWTDAKLAAKEFPGFAFMGEYMRGKQAMQVVPSEGKFYLSTYGGGLPGRGWDGDDVAHAWVDADAIEARLKGWDKIDRSKDVVGVRPPKDAIVLFDGSGTDAWSHAKTEGGLLQAGAKTKDEFQDFTLHLEYLLPLKPELPLSHPHRGNSGVFAVGAYEVQICDSFGLDPNSNAWQNMVLLKPVSTWCGGIYGIREADLNMCLPPLAWQSLEIEFTAARFKGGAKVSPAVMTVIQNGVKVHDRVSLPGGTGGGPAGPRPEVAKGPVYLQHHGDPNQFRNIWIVQH